MVARNIPRVHEIILPVLRAQLPGVMVTSWIPDVDKRTFPLLNVRRLGGIPNYDHPDHLDRPVIELTAYTGDGRVPTENLLYDAMYVLHEMVDKQTVTSAGWLNSYRVTMGPTPFDSPFEDSWGVQTLIQLGVRSKGGRSTGPSLVGYGAQPYGVGGYGV